MSVHIGRGYGSSLISISYAPDAMDEALGSRTSVGPRFEVVVKDSPEHGRVQLKPAEMRAFIAAAQELLDEHKKEK